MSAAEWLAQIALSARGRVWRGNVAYDLAKRRLPATAWDAFLRHVEDRFAAAKASDPLALVDEALRDRPVEFLLRGPDFPGPSHRWSRVIDALSYARFNVDRDLGLETDENVDGRLLALMDAGIYQPRHQVGEMKGRQDFIWCTTAAALDELGRWAKGDDLANAIRDSLGLGTWRLGVYMLRIDLPEAAVVGKIVRAPTTFDGGSNVYFTPHADPAGFGWTLHLGRLEPGAPELVVEKLRFDESFTVSRVGRVARPQPDLNWEQWAQLREARVKTATPAAAVADVVTPSDREALP